MVSITIPILVYIIFAVLFFVSIILNICKIILRKKIRQLNKRYCINCQAWIKTFFSIGICKNKKSIWYNYERLELHNCNEWKKRYELRRKDQRRDKEKI